MPEKSPKLSDAGGLDITGLIAEQPEGYSLAKSFYLDPEIFRQRAYLG